MSKINCVLNAIASELGKIAWWENKLTSTMTNLFSQCSKNWDFFVTNTFNVSTCKLKCSMRKIKTKFENELKNITNEN